MEKQNNVFYSEIAVESYNFLKVSVFFSEGGRLNGSDNPAGVYVLFLPVEKSEKGEHYTLGFADPSRGFRVCVRTLEKRDVEIENIAARAIGAWTGEFAALFQRGKYYDMACRAKEIVTNFLNSHNNETDKTNQ